MSDYLTELIQNKMNRIKISKMQRIIYRFDYALRLIWYGTKVVFKLIYLKLKGRI
ncbi:MAG: hypothetical protein ABDH21_05005 [bacterium]